MGKPRFRRGQGFCAASKGGSPCCAGAGEALRLLHRRERFEVFVGLAVLAKSLLVIADLLTHRVRQRTASPPRRTSRRSRHGRRLGRYLAVAVMPRQNVLCPVRNLDLESPSDHWHWVSLVGLSGFDTEIES